MKRANNGRLLLVFLAVTALMVLAFTGCEVTAEKVDMWKGTQNGPKKLAAAVAEPELTLELRSRAAVALVEINNWDLFREAFTKMDKAEAAKVADAVTPLLAKMIEGTPNERSLSKAQVDAKDGLFMLLEFVGPVGRPAANTALIGWCTKDFNERAMAGQFQITTVIKQIGSPAAEALVPMLNTKELVIKYVAELIKEVNDPKVLAKASAQYGKELETADPSTLREIHLVAASVIGGAPIGKALLQLATDKKLDAKLQRLALRAFSKAVEDKTITLNEKMIEALIGLAENEEYDPYQREETYYVIAQGERASDLPRLRKLLAHKEPFWRAVAVRCLLRVDAEGQLLPTLQEIEKLRLAASAAEIREIIDRISSFPSILPKFKELLGDKSVFVRAVAVTVLAKKGTAADLKAVLALGTSSEPMPKGFEQKTLGAAAKAAAESIKQRG